MNKILPAKHLNLTLSKYDLLLILIKNSSCIYFSFPVFSSISHSCFLFGFWDVLCLLADKYKCKQSPRQLEFSAKCVYTLLPSQPSADGLVNECLLWVVDETWHAENFPRPSIQSSLKLALLVQPKRHLAENYLLVLALPYDWPEDIQQISCTSCRALSSSSAEVCTVRLLYS